MRNLRQGSMAFLGSLLITSCVCAAPPERPTLNHTADPRPNILPDWIYNHHVPYRLRYNRPTYVGGKIAYHISPTSQEAMAWEENLDRGRYDGLHCPPLVKRYIYPKPWEALNTGPRPTYSVQPAEMQPGAVQPDSVQPAPVRPEAVVPQVQQTRGVPASPTLSGRSTRPGVSVRQPQPGHAIVKQASQRKP